MVLDYFLPGFKGGGSLRSIANLVDRLGDEFAFDVLTRDRDIKDELPYPGIEPGWNRRDGYRIRYVAPNEITPWGIAAALRPWRYDALYLNSLFSTLNVLLLVLRRAGRIPATPVVLAPRGELAPKALALKATKKAFYLSIVQRLRMVNGVLWQASSELERADVRRRFPGPVQVAIDVPPRPRAAPRYAPPPKSPGSARFAFLSRLERKKNLATAIELVARLEGDVRLDIWGNRHDEGYCRECDSLIAEIPGGRRCSFRGPLHNEEVVATLARSHFFLFPTLNENFGHVILEALCAGLPLVISNETPWVGLAGRGIGFDLPLADEAAFLDCLQRCVQMEEGEYRRLSTNAASAAQAFMEDPEPLRQTRRLLRSALNGSAP